MFFKFYSRDILDEARHPFLGNFNAQCQESYVPLSLKALVTMILRGANVNNVKNPYLNQAALTILQLMIFNSTIRTRKASSQAFHTTRREPPLAVYIGQLLHSQTRKLNLVRKMSHLGLSISPDRLLDIATKMGNKAIAVFEKEGVVCPLNLRHDLFTTAATDNIDVNTSSATAMSAFHGTATSVNQHINGGNSGRSRDIPEGLPSSTVLKNLPEKFTNVKPGYLPPRVPICKVASCGSFNASGDFNLSEDCLNADRKWLEHVKGTEGSDAANISWATYHASQLTEKKQNPDLSALLPVWRDDSKSPAMIMHSLDVVKDAVTYLNPEQTPVVAFDQPLFALAKKIQWHHPDIYGQMVIMMGPLHIEMAFMKTVGDFLKDSGWTTLITNVQVAHSGVAESLLSGHDVVRTKYSHQVTASALYKLQHKAYIERQENEARMNFNEWCYLKEEKNPTFQFWSIVLKMELVLFQFLRSIRTGNFQLYLHSMEKMIPWFFALDHFHYARWLSVHVYDMRMLEITNANVYEAFDEFGCFVVSRTKKPFSSMGLDQRHEQHNKDVKGDGGALGLTEDEEKLHHWMVCGPEVARAVAEFEMSSILRKEEPTDFRHHEKTPAFQKRFFNHVTSTTEEFIKLGNPFSDCCGDDLVQISMRDAMDDAVVKTVRTIEDLGKKAYEDFIKERINSCTKEIEDPVKKNKFPLFSTLYSRKQPSRSDAERKSLKNDVRIFSHLFIATQTRNGDLDTFFSHENSANPPSLACDGKIRPGVKADLLHCLKKASTTDSFLATNTSEAQSICNADSSDTGTAEPDNDQVIMIVPEKVDGKVLEGSVLVNFLKPAKQSTFAEYARTVFVPKVIKELETVERVDIVFDTYRKESLKATTRQKRGIGIRRKVEEQSQVPTNWHSFLRIDRNKTELFRVLSEKIITSIETNKIVVTAFEDKALISNGAMVGNLSPCNHEEADTRVFLHALDMRRHNSIEHVMIKTVDTDVVVLAVALFAGLNVKELWIDFGSGQNQAYYPIHTIYNSLRPEKSKGLLFFHAFTGCDQTSFFANCRKKSAWSTWFNFDGVTETFIKLSSKPTITTVKEAMPMLERFVVLMYDQWRLVNRAFWAIPPQEKLKKVKKYLRSNS